MSSIRFSKDFFKRDVLEVAPDLLGNLLIIKYDHGLLQKFIITEVEAYRGEEDLACHASKGRTKRTEIMYHEGGHLYVYLIYGMYWMLNIVTGKENNPQAVLIRGLQGFDGPGKLTKFLQIDKSFNGENLQLSNRIWIEKNNLQINNNYTVAPRIGIDYAGEIWKNKPWRYILSLKSE
ncbi:MAG: DNA-3-methyladenine glycosylase [Bacteroidales bacterium]|jgi:DNA-3-methyladenine glycosylase|nr:DNA-3-methyladenine glycosylase [Bacteroidales bacterium]